MNKKKADRLPEMEQVAGNGLLHRRVFLAQGAALLGGGFMSPQANGSRARST